jgi:hypothetical protein
MIEMHVHVEALDTRSLSRPERIMNLRGQLTLIRLRAERGIPVSVESIGRAEQLARSLETVEVTE